MAMSEAIIQFVEQGMVWQQYFLRYASAD